MSEARTSDTRQNPTARRAVRERSMIQYSGIAKTATIYFLLVVMSLIVLVPLMWGFSASLTPNEQVFDNLRPFSWRAFVPTNFTLEAYRAIFRDNDFGRAILNSFILAFSGVFLGSLLSTTAGFAFSRFDFPGRRFFFAITLFTFMIPTNMTAIPSYILVDKLGWIGSWSGLIIPSLVNGLVIFLFVQYFREIPQDLIDAARVDGASWFRLFFFIILPISKPVLITASLIMFLEHWGAFFWPLLVAPQEEMRVVQVAIAFSVEEYQTLWNQLLAGSMLAAIIPIVLVLPLQRYYVQGITGSGLKQ